MKKRFLSCAIVLLLVIACISGLSARAYATENVNTDYICFFEVSPLNFWYVRDMGEIMSQSVFDGC